MFFSAEIPETVINADNKMITIAVIAQIIWIYQITKKESIVQTMINKQKLLGAVERE